MIQKEYRIQANEKSYRVQSRQLRTFLLCHWWSGWTVVRVFGANGWDPALFDTFEKAEEFRESLQDPPSWVNVSC